MNLRFSDLSKSKPASDRQKLNGFVVMMQPFGMERNGDAMQFSQPKFENNMESKQLGANGNGIELIT